MIAEDGRLAKLLDSIPAAEVGAMRRFRAAVRPLALAKLPDARRAAVALVAEVEAVAARLRETDQRLVQAENEYSRLLGDAADFEGRRGLPPFPGVSPGMGPLAPHVGRQGPARGQGRHPGPPGTQSRPGRRPGHVLLGMEPGGPAANAAGEVVLLTPLGASPNIRSMRCPHCLDAYHDNAAWHWVGHDRDGTWAVMRTDCPSCKRTILFLVCGEAAYNSSVPHSSSFSRITHWSKSWPIHPRGQVRPCPQEVRSEHPGIAADFAEACAVFADSPKASAALSRRCLQRLLRDKAGATQKDLADQIQAVLDSNKLPSHMSETLDAVRNIGNFAAHPIKSRSSGEIVEVEPGEAEWNLDTLEALFDFYYVQPAVTKARREALNKKLADAGKPPVK